MGPERMFWRLIVVTVLIPLDPRASTLRIPCTPSSKPPNPVAAGGGPGVAQQGCSAGGPGARDLRSTLQHRRPKSHRDRQRVRLPRPGSAPPPRNEPTSIMARLKQRPRLSARDMRSSSTTKGPLCPL